MAGKEEELTSCPDTSITSRSLQHATCTRSVPPCGWPWLAAEPHTIAPSLSPVSRVRKGKSKTKQNTCVRDKSCLINKGKEEQRKKIKKWCKSHGSPPPTGKTDVHPTSKQWLRTKKQTFFCWSQCHMVWNIPVFSWGQLSRLCPLHASGTGPASSLWGAEGQTGKVLMLSPNSSATAQTQVSYHHCFGHKSKVEYWTGCYKEN